MPNRILVTLVVCLAVTACQTPPHRARPEGAVPAFPDAAYQRAAAQGEVVYDLQPAGSTLRIFLFRTGALATFGHSHVIVADTFRGALAWPKGAITEARLDLTVPVDGLRVDPPDVRRKLGGALGEPLGADARRGTRDNMLGSAVLDAKAFPRIAVTLAGVQGELPRPILDLEVHVKGAVATLSVPVAVSLDGDRLTADGRAILRQSDLGMTPFTAVGGALKVADPMVIDFHLVGRRRGGGTEAR